MVKLLKGVFFASFIYQLVWRHESHLGCLWEVQWMMIPGAFTMPFGPDLYLAFWPWLVGWGGASLVPILGGEGKK